MSSIPIPGQITLQVPSAIAQSSFQKIIGEISSWNPECPIPMVMKIANNIYRSLIDERNWYGLMVRGQCAVPSVYCTGTATVTNGSADVVGNGTTWTQAMAGRQFRIGFTTGWITVLSVTDETHLTLALPWGDQSYSSIGYQIVQTWVSLGPNVKMVLEMLNQKQGYRLFPNIPQKIINTYDTWRTNMGWTFAFSPIETRSADGWPQIELYPSPTFQQVFPYLAYIQPPDLIEDNDTPAPFIRSDIIVMGAVAEVLLFGGPKSRYYDSNTSNVKRTMFRYEVEKLKFKDEDLYPKDLISDFNIGFSQHGSQWLQSHAEEI